MKFITTICLGLALLCGGELLASPQTLQGQTFQRTFETTPMGATTPMTFTHALVFGADWKVVDNSSCWFGNPPTTCNYGLEFKGKKKELLDRVTVICNGYVTRYKFVKEGDSSQLVNGETVLSLSK
jgi:hypothetical protein